MLDFIRYDASGGLDRKWTKIGYQQKLKDFQFKVIKQLIKFIKTCLFDGFSIESASSRGEGVASTLAITFFLKLISFSFHFKL